MRLVIITNMPAPYRIPSWNIIAERMGNDFLVIFCSRAEPNRKWNVPEMKFRHHFLKENFYAKNDNTTFVHNNRDVWQKLKQFNPDVVITGGFNPTMLYAFLYCVIYRKKHIPLSDAWEMSEKHLSSKHRMLRKLIFRFSSAFLACSQKGKAYYKSYGQAGEKIFIAHYTINNSSFANSKTYEDRRYDLLFSGQLTERKNPQFFVRVAVELSKQMPGLSVLVLGDGPLRETLIGSLEKAGIRYHYPGYASQEQLPGFYADSRIFLFPTSYDAWGVVANESLAAATPVMVTPYAGCAGELVIDESNGYIAELEISQWVDHCMTLLGNKEKWARFSAHAMAKAAEFTHEKAANAFMEAGKFAMKQ